MMTTSRVKRNLKSIHWTAHLYTFSTLSILFVIALSKSAHAHDYITVQELYAQCTSSSDVRKAACFGYVEGVTAAFVSISTDNLPTHQQPEFTRRIGDKLDSDKIVSRFVRKYRSGHFTTAGRGASFFVTETIIELVSE